MKLRTYLSKTKSVKKPKKLRLSSIENEIVDLTSKAESLQKTASLLSNQSHGLLRSVSHEILPSIDSPAFETIINNLTNKISLNQSAVIIASDATLPFFMIPSPASTENNALTHATSGSALVDFFFNIIKAPSFGVDNQNNIEKHLESAWKENPLDSLQLIAHLRDIRNGKSERLATYAAISWLLENHPLTAIANLKRLVTVGYWKDILAILQARCLGQRFSRPKVAAKKNRWIKIRHKRELLRQRSAALKALPTKNKKENYLQDRSNLQDAKVRIEKLKAAILRREKRIEDIMKAKMSFENDDVYCLLHLSVAKIFAEELIEDKKRLSNQSLKSFSSLAAKWAPTATKCYDKNTLISSTIAELIFPASEYKQENQTKNDYVNKVLDMYRKEILTPLRKASKLPEVYMSANQWDNIPYNRVASVCMKNNNKHFSKHSEERFSKYLENVKSGKSKIAAGALKPDGLLEVVLKSMTSDSEKLTAELQWKDYVNTIKSKGTLSNCLAVCDVSGSMEGEPMRVAIALSLLISEIATPPYNNIVCTFSQSPTFHVVTGDTLASRYICLKRMQWGMNTDFNAVFKLILKKALAVKLPQKEMISTVFVFSDMEFDQASADGEGTNFEQIKRLFEENGYKLPKIVFWNLRSADNRTHGRGYSSTPTPALEENVALISGYSGQLLRLFMDGKLDSLETFNPVNVMNAAIKCGRYDDWVVVD